MDVTSRASAERTAAIVQGDLPNRAKKVLSRDFELGDFGDQYRRDAGTQDVGHATFGSDEAEHAIGGCYQPSREADALSLITVEQLIGRVVAKGCRQFPGKIDGVADPGVHALAAGRAVDMRGVAQ